MAKKSNKIIDYMLTNKYEGLKPLEFYTGLSPKLLVASRYSYRKTHEFSVFLVKEKGGIYWYCYPFFHGIFKTKVKSKKDFKKVIHAMAQHAELYSM